MKITKQSAFTAAALFGILPAAHAGGDAKSIIIPAPAKPSDGHWEVHAGFGIRQSFDLNIRSSSRDLLGGSYSSAAATSALYAGVGSANAEADRLYDDGFVNIGSRYNLTTNWGYDNASQVAKASRPWNPSQPWDSPGNQSLYMTRTGQMGMAGFDSGTDTDEALFPYIEARRWWDCDKDSFWTEKGFVASWSWIPTDGGLTESLAMQRTRVVDEYYLYGVLPPAAPYSGPVRPPGPLLDNIPHDRVEGSAVAGVTGTTHADVDLDLHTLSFGGIWRYAPKEDRGGFDRMRLYGLDLQAGVSVNFVRLEMDSQTTVVDRGTVIGSYSDHGSESKILPGLFLSVGATFDIGEKEEWMLFTQGRYDYAGDIDVQTGLSSAEVDLEGFSWTIGIGKRW